MGEPSQESIKLTTDTDQYSVIPGGSLDITLVLTNQSQAPDQARIMVEGIPLAWVSTGQPLVLLQPGEERRMLLTIQPPAPPNAHAGRYSLRLSAAGTLNPAQSAEALVTLTVAGFEIKGRVGVLLDSLKYSVVPGEQLAIPVVLINNGLVADTIQVAAEGLPVGWVAVSTQDVHLEPGEETSAMLVVQPPRQPVSRAGRYPFRIRVTSPQAPDQSASIDCTLTVAAFIQFNSTLEAAAPEQKLPSRVRVQSLSNVPATFQVSWDSPENALVFEPAAPVKINVPAGGASELQYSAKAIRRLWVGDEKSHPYTVSVRASDGQTQTLNDKLNEKALLPVWAAAAGAGVLLLVCLCLFVALFLRVRQTGELTTTPQLTGTVLPTLAGTQPAVVPTTPGSQTDQKALLVGRKWYLVAYNETHSSPGVQEAYTLFNPDGTLIGYTGCKDLSGTYQTNLNQISIANVNLSSGTCSDPALQPQEDAMLATLRSARSYYVADTALQIAGDSGFLIYSLTPVERPEEILPPQAVIKAVPQAMAGQVVVFDGSASTGQVPLVAWKWDFGDGTSASGVIVQHGYLTPGAYNVQLTVTDQRVQTGSNAQQILILPQPAPTAMPTQPPTPTSPPPPTNPPALTPPSAKVNGPGYGYVGTPLEFDASNSRPGSSAIVSYSWSFGNGSVQPASPSPIGSTTYNSTGNYEVTVTIVDANGLSDNATTHISIDAQLDTQIWTLASINGQPILPGTAITLQFLNGLLAGFSGCNTYDGKYTATDAGNGSYSVTVERVSSSMRSCPADILDQEQAYKAALQQTTSAAIQENMLTLTNPTGTLVFYLMSAP
jgi:heat shock protein HslJ